MKNLFCLLILVVSWGVIKAITEKELMGALEIFGNKCDPPPEELDYKNIIRNEIDVRKETKCFRYCLMNQTNMLVDCKMNVEIITDLMTMVFEDKEEEIAEIISDCNVNENCEDMCTTSHNYAMCILDKCNSKGWPIPEIDEED